MDKRDRGAPALETLREFARQRVEQTSLREVGTQVGITHSAVEKFLRGAKPHARTLALYVSWYSAYVRARRAKLDDPAYRLIPEEDLRAFTEAQVERNGLRQVERITGVGRSTLANFINRVKAPHPQTRRALGLYYLRRGGIPGEEKKPTRRRKARAE